MAPQPHILLLGATGRISKLMIPLFLSRCWSVTALIRDPKQTDSILALRPFPSDAATKPLGKLDVLVHSLADVKTSHDAAAVIAKAGGVNWVVWSAGAGAEDTPESKKLTYAIDRDAAVAFAHAATHNDQIERYLTISAINIRRKPAPWWTREVAEAIKNTSEGELKVYTEAKIVADECLTVWGNERRARDPDFKYVVLRPWWLVDDVDEENKGKVQLGRTNDKKEDSRQIGRDEVAKTADELLDRGANGWFDLVGGNKNIKEAVTEVMKTGVEGTTIEGEKLEDMKKTADRFYDE